MDLGATPVNTAQGNIVLCRFASVSEVNIHSSDSIDNKNNSNNNTDYNDDINLCVANPILQTYNKHNLTSRCERNKIPTATPPH